MIKILKNFLTNQVQNSSKSRKNYDNELDQLVSRRMSLNKKISKTLDHENELLKNLVGLRGITAYDVMVPRIDIISVSMSDNFNEIVKQLTLANHSRVPVIGEGIDNVVGILHIKDVLAKLHSKETTNIKTLLKEPIFVAPSISLLDLLHEMRIKKRHMALVVDEYGGIDGLVTIEDLVEELVGEIEDEHDESNEIKIELIDKDSVIVEAKISLDLLKKELNINSSELVNNELETLGGFIISLTGRVPVNGEVVREPQTNVEFEILEADPRKIILVKIKGLMNLNDKKTSPN